MVNRDSKPNNSISLDEHKKNLENKSEEFEAAYYYFRNAYGQAPEVCQTKETSQADIQRLVDEHMVKTSSPKRL